VWAEKPQTWLSLKHMVNQVFALIPTSTEFPTGSGLSPQKILIKPKMY
jgi:hypothetical protein